jgi:hypothetical protein
VFLPLGLSLSLSLSLSLFLSFLLVSSLRFLSVSRHPLMRPTFSATAVALDSGNVLPHFQDFRSLETQRRFARRYRDISTSTFIKHPLHPLCFVYACFPRGCIPWDRRRSSRSMYRFPARCADARNLRISDTVHDSPRRLNSARARSGERENAAFRAVGITYFVCAAVGTPRAAFLTFRCYGQGQADTGMRLLFA